MYVKSDFQNQWSVSMGKGDADVKGKIVVNGKKLGEVSITISKFRIEVLGYDADMIVRAAERAFFHGLNTGQYKEIADALKA